eukprot:4967365-Lingulodinium_polyedra.AAC.1
MPVAISSDGNGDAIDCGSSNNKDNSSNYGKLRGNINAIAKCNANAHADYSGGGHACHVSVP